MGCWLLLLTVNIILFFLRPTVYLLSLRLTDILELNYQ